uniref:Uncharacterized protein n=1 Tax=viral metagenome TaxID=1070528 RepID=A0A6M3L471_9ZZZZ
MNIEERLKEAQNKRQELVNRAIQLGQQLEELTQQRNQLLLECNKLDGKIEAYTLMRDEHDGNG